MTGTDGTGGFATLAFVRDVAALNKVELLPWDGWGIIDKPDEALSAEDLTFLDQVATLTRGDVPDFVEVQRLYTQDHRLRVPPIINSYTQTGRQTVELPGV